MLPASLTCQNRVQMWPGLSELGLGVSQGYHLKRGQRPPGGSHVLFLSEQPQQDVFFILGPAVDMSVL